MAAAGLTVGVRAKDKPQGTITTSDAALSIVTMATSTNAVIVQVRGADGLLQLRGAVQDAAVGTTTPLLAGSIWEIDAMDCERTAAGLPFFGLARSAAGAIFDVLAAR